MADLPSYHEATSRPDWLELVVPYVAFRDYYSLCLVDRRFWATFGPRLWRNLLSAVRYSGLDPGDDLEWWFSFVYDKLPRVRQTTREWVRVLDARGFSKESYDFVWDREERTLLQSFKRAFSLLPSISCILLDGHEDLEPSFLVGSEEATDHHHQLLLLSIADCASQLPNTFFNSPSLQKLVYLDISGVPGSIKPLIQPTVLPDLRVLKVRHRELDDSTFAALSNLLRLRIWGLDISYNKITDSVIDTMVSKYFPATQLRSSAFFRTEGKLVALKGGSPEYGAFVLLEESDQSRTFDHPERYFTDAPIYLADLDHGPQEYQTFRSNGCDALRQDTAGAAAASLSDPRAYISEDSLYRGQGVTHLSLSHNEISVAGLERLICKSNGQLEQLTCDSLPLLPKSNDVLAHWPRGVRLYGAIGVSHMIRPVFSSNLRTLRMHHSIVTNIPSMEREGLSSLARAYISETAVLDRVKQLYPQTFVPDMNPRLLSLTLTHVPRRSTGNLIASLVLFLRLLSQQEAAIQEVRLGNVTSWRAPGVLKGLRHLRLEFDSDPMEEGFSASDDLDAEELMNGGEQAFSFFDEQVEGSPATRPAVTTGQETNSSHSSGADGSHESGRTHDDFVTFEGEWNGEAFSVSVWVGARTSSRDSVINAYRSLVLDGGVRQGVGPASPSQVMAGAPEKSFIFQTAWRMAIMMPSSPSLPSPRKEVLAGMSDVLAALKKYRADGRAAYTEAQERSGGSPARLGSPHFFWTGKLEVTTEESMPHGRASEYWR